MTPTRRIFIFIALPLVILFIGLAVYLSSGGKNSTASTKEDGTTTSQTSCDKTELQSPVDVSHVVSILYPGQTRGDDYKPHGGFRLNNTENNLANVVAPLAAKVTGGSRYIEMNELQYMFDFKTDCGLEYRFDHLKTLSPKLQAAADKLPEAEVDDSRTNRVSNVSVEAGEIIATAVGFEKSPPGAPEGPNASFDFGLYDKRQKNAASEDSSWVAARKEEGDQAIYAVCWLDWLPAADSAVLKALPGGDSTSGKTSDYCR